MTGAHVFYIPGVLCVGIVIGFILKGLLARDQRATPRRRPNLTDLE